jgi:hypothetical protein
MVAKVVLLIFGYLRCSSYTTPDPIYFSPSRSHDVVRPRPQSVRVQHRAHGALDFCIFIFFGSVFLFSLVFLLFGALRVSFFDPCALEEKAKKKKIANHKRLKKSNARGLPRTRIVAPQGKRRHVRAAGAL